MNKFFFPILILCLVSINLAAQDYIIADFEDGNAVFNIDGSEMPASIVDNPDKTGINSSDKVLKIQANVDKSDDLIAYLDPIINIYTNPILYLKVYCKDSLTLAARIDRPSNWAQNIVTSEFPFSNPTEWDIAGDDRGSWVEFTYDLSKWDNISGYGNLRIMAVSRGKSDSTFYIDDVKMLEGDSAFSSSSIVPLFYEPVSTIKYVGDWAGDCAHDEFEYKIVKDGYERLNSDTITISYNGYTKYPNDTISGCSGGAAYILTGSGTTSASLTFPIPSSGADNKTFQFDLSIRGSSSTGIEPVVEYTTNLKDNNTEWTELSLSGISDQLQAWSTVTASISEVSDYTTVRISNTTSASDSIEMWIDDITLLGSLTLSDSIDVTGTDDLDVVCVGGTLQMLLNQSPGESSNIGRWSTSSSAADISAKGVLSGVSGPGKVWVYGETIDGTDLKDSIKITITADTILSDTVEISSDKDALTKSDSIVQLYASVKPANAVDKTYSWSIDNTEIASITEDGLLKATDDGTVIVTATANDENAATGTKTFEITGFTPDSSANSTDDVYETIGVFPNPVDNILYFDVVDKVELVSIIALDGSTIKIDDSGNSEINVSDLNAGIYFIKIINVNDKVYQARFVKK